MKDYLQKQKEMIDKLFELYAEGLQIWIEVSPHVKAVKIYFYTNINGKISEVLKDLPNYNAWTDETEPPFTGVCFWLDDNSTEEMYNIVIKTLEHVKNGEIEVVKKEF